MSIKALQRTPRSASRFTSLGPAWMTYIGSFCLMKIMIALKVCASFAVAGIVAGCCGISTKTTLEKGPEISRIQIKQDAWGMHIFQPALYGINIQFKNDQSDWRGVIPASSLTIQDTGMHPVFPNDLPPTYNGYVRYDEKENNVDIRLYEILTDVHGKQYFPEHPLNGVRRVNTLIEDKMQNSAVEPTRAPEGARGSP
jgi:hypothetical protein